jgi:hypothetical protein
MICKLREKIIKKLILVHFDIGVVFGNLKKKKIFYLIIIFKLFSPFFAFAQGEGVTPTATAANPLDVDEPDTNFIGNLLIEGALFIL